ncbi:MAG: mannose-1-phosphate guanylyltransferase [Ignavibacteriales bacterium]|nr:mannose-1-phosphate guanylyltransferase [Ignavibacteriales bacterium]
MNQPNIYAVIMAGGVGSRFWPQSRERSPKQVLEIVGSGSMISNTIARIQPLVQSDKVLVVTNKLQKDIIHNQVPSLPLQNVLTEPLGRNTAPCIGLAAKWISRNDPNAIMIILPADHIIRDTEEFLCVLRRAAHVAQESNALVTIGIKPTHPETGYGYIQFEDTSDKNPYAADSIYRVKTFAEKPNLETAEKFLKSGDFLWNSGMFIWKASVILQEIEKYIPELSEQLIKLEHTIGTESYQATLERVYGVIRSISIDYGVMEKASNVFVARGDFGWSDVGSWDEVVRLTPIDGEGNALRGTVIAKDSHRNYIDAGNKVVATIGIEDAIVVVTDDAVLICKKGRSQDVKEVVDYLRRKQINGLL